MKQNSTLKRLEAMIRAIERRSSADEVTATVPTGWEAIDSILQQYSNSPGLNRGSLHEVFGLAPAGNASELWVPPLRILAHLAWQAMEVGSSAAWVVWVGRPCWPHPWALVRSQRLQPDQQLLRQSLFVDPPDHASRLWAIDLALRCRGVALVVAEGQKLDISATRRLQLAAEAARGCALLVRPVTELKQLSVAATRWRIASLRSTSGKPRWAVELLRCRPGHPPDLPAWTLELSHDQGIVLVPAHVADRSAAADTTAEPRSQQRKTA